ncbi:HAD hydrolase-like protein [Desulfurobacterium sp.]
MKTIVFDFDGTLADTFDIAIDAYNKIAPFFRIKTVSGSDRELIKGLSLEEFAEVYGVSEQKFLLLVLILRYLMNREKERKRIKIHNGLLTVIRKLSSSGFKCGILTTNSKKFVSSVLKENRISGDFLFIETNVFLRQKYKTLFKLKENYGDIVYICDEGRDIIAAKKAGVTCVAVTWGFSSFSNLSRFSPDFVVSSPGDLLNVLVNL